MEHKFRVTDFFVGFLAWFVINTACWYAILQLQPTIVDITSSADQKHLIDFWLNVLPWLMFLVVMTFLIFRRRWRRLAGWLGAALVNNIALFFFLPYLSNTGLVPEFGQILYRLFNIPISVLFIPNVINVLYLWLL